MVDTETFIKTGDKIRNCRLFFFCHGDKTH